MTALLATLLLLAAPIAAHSATRSAGMTATSGITATIVAARTAGGTDTYTNPVITETAPDPAVIKALDGYYYQIPTSDFWPGGAYHNFPIFRSTDLVHWTYLRDAFPQKPDWVGSGLLFAPDLQYYNHKYYMYYTASNTAPLPRYGTTGGSAIGVATADSPAGPWSDAGDSAGGTFQHGPIVPPRQNSVDKRYFDTIDPAEFTDQNGQKYLYYGSYFGGTLVQKLNPDGLHVSGQPIQVGHWDRYEGTYVIRHDVGGRPYYYNFSSTANCCVGPNTAYSVVVSRATSPLGPFVDQNGFPMESPAPIPAATDSSADPASYNLGAEGGGYSTLKQNGNRWHGVGHNAIITDLAGHDWIVYHAVDKTAGQGWVPGLDPGASITYRQGLIDRLDWTAGGWPVVNAGTGPSDTPRAAPVTTGLIGDNFNTPDGSGGCVAPGNGDDLDAMWREAGGHWRVEPGTCTTGGFVEQRAARRSLLVSKMAVPAAPAGNRTECDVRLVNAVPRGYYGCVVAYRPLHEGAIYLAATLDPARNTLVTAAYVSGASTDAPAGALEPLETALPAGFDHTDWHHLTIDQQADGAGNTRVRVTVSDRNRDPLAVQQRSFPAVFVQRGGGIGFTTFHARADFDNVTTAPLDQAAVPTPQVPPVGAALPQYSAEFSSGTLDLKQWSWIREDPSKHAFVGGQLSITVDGDLYRDSNNATNILLENQPAGDYVVETKMAFDPRDNFQQAGLIVYSDDDHYIKVGAHHHFSLNKFLSGRETLEPQPASATPGQPPCDLQAPSPNSNVAVTAYTHDLCPNEGESWDYLTNAQPITNGLTAPDPHVTDWLRIYRQGNVYTPYVSVDGAHWVRGAAWDLSAADPTRFPVRIGLFAFSGGPHNDIPARFAYVRVSRLP